MSISSLVQENSSRTSISSDDFNPQQSPGSSVQGVEKSSRFLSFSSEKLPSPAKLLPLSKGRKLAAIGTAGSTISRSDSFPSENLESPLSSINKKSKFPASSSKVITGFRANTIPEYKGHMPRCGHTAIAYKCDFFIFGGINNKNQYPPHVYRHEKRSLQWEEVRGGGVVPTGRANHSAILHKTKMIVYGGQSYLDVFDDLYSFDFEARKWDKIGYEKRQGPGPVFLHTAVEIPPTQSMAVIGGFHQREHNMYVGHMLDIKSRVWSGIPGPYAVNLQHLQLVTAAFDAKTDSLVVLGFTESNDAFSSRMQAPYVYLMNIHSYVWTKVETSSSPESPIPFRLDVIWEKFIREFIMMGGGFHDTITDSWFFPITIESVLESKGYKPESSVSSVGAVSVTGNRSKPKYGLFKLQLDDMKWSLIPMTLPRKLTLELVQKNRDGMLQRHAITKPSAPSTTTAVGSGRETLQTLNSTGLEKTLESPSAETEVSLQKKVTLFSVEGNPQFQRKYAFAAIREGSTPKNGRKLKSKAMQYLVMHGGLSPGTDYAIIMLIPQISRTDAFTATRLESGDTESSPGQSRTSRWTDDFEDSHMGMTTSRSRFHMSSASSYAGGNAGLEDSRRIFNSLEGDNFSCNAKQQCLLPILPCTQNKKNMERFAMLYHPNNSFFKEELMPYPNIPVVVLEASRDIQHWAQRYYADSRKWFAEQLHGAVQDERGLRRLRREQRKTSFTSSDFSEDDEKINLFPTEDVVSSSKTKIDKVAPSSTASDGKDGFNMSSTPAVTEEEEVQQSDFFARTGLYLFGMGDFQDERRKKKGKNDPLSILPSVSKSLESEKTESSSGVSGLERLNMRVKRHEEKQRIAENVFYSESGAMVGDLGSAMALVLMQNALNEIPPVTKENRSKRARIRWRCLRALVRTGEAAFIVYRATQEEAKMKGLSITSSPGLLLAPELHLVGPVRSFKVTSRPVPYTVPVRTIPVLAPSAEYTTSGMVVYSNMMKKD